ncbi:MAG: T9SS type A sorting domain-containing protein [Bacteroidota bacterium]
MNKTYSHTKKLFLLLLTLFSAQFVIAANISVQPPTTATVCTNGTVTIPVTATGTTFQWQYLNGATWTNLTNTAPYSGVNTTTLTITNPAITYNGVNLRFTATGGAGGNKTSTTCVLTVNALPVINTQPVAATICAGQNTSFTVAATGTTLTYQWKVSTAGAAGPYNNITNGGVYSGATSATLNITAATAGMNNYYYECVVSGAGACSATSTGVLLTVNTAPAITTQPHDSTLCFGANAIYAVYTSGTGLVYQWKVSTTGVAGPYNNITNGGFYMGANSAALVVFSPPVTMSGYYYECLITGTCNPPITTTPRLLTVNALPAITTQPSAAITCAGQNTSFSVVATGTALAYQWKVSTTGIAGTYNNITNGPVYSNANTATLNITAATVAMNGYYYECVVSGACSPTVTTTPQLLTVNALPAITTQPISTSTCPGNNATFTVGTSGTGITYQWYENQGSGFNPLSNTGVYSGATSNSLTITGATAGMNGYIYQCIVSGTCTPSVTTNNDTLFINTVLSFTTQPSDVNACAGDNINYSVAAAGTGLTYQWMVNQGSGYNNVPNTGVYTGANTATLSINGVLANMNGYSYHCMVGSTCAAPTASNDAELNVNTLPAVTTQPISKSVCANGNTSFSLAATGTGITYQWMVDQGSGFNPLSNTGIYNGVTSNILTITGALQSMNGYHYKCVISGTCTPPATSNSVLLTVNPNLVPTVNITGVSTVCNGMFVYDTATTNIIGGSYQWKVNNGNMGINSNTFSYMPVNGDQITCVVTIAPNTCYIPTSAGSNTISMNVTPFLTPATPVITSNSPVCAPNSVYILATCTTPSVSYSWNGPSNFTSSNPNITFNPSTTSEGGIYSVTVTTINGCTSFASAHIFINASPVVSSINFVNPTTCSGTNGSITLNGLASNTTFSITYTKNGVPFGPISATSNALGKVTITGLTAATYDAIVLTPNGGGCSSIPNGPVYMNNPNPPLPPVITSNSPICIGSTLTLGISSPISGGLYVWSGPAGFSATTATATVNNFNASTQGAYQVYVTDPLTNCTSLTSSTNAILNATVNTVMSISGDTSVCSGNTALYSAATNIPGAIYQWKVNNLPVGTNASTFSYVPVNGDIVTCTVSAPAGVCYSPSVVTSNAITVHVHIVQAPIASVNGNTQACAGISQSYTVTTNVTGGSYQWLVNGTMVGSNNNTYTYLPNNNDSIFCVVTAGACYSSPTATSSTLYITVNPSTTTNIAINGSTSVISGTSTTYTAFTNVTGGSYQWKVNNLPVGTNASTYTYVPINNDQVNCTITAPAGTCYAPNSLTSITLHVTVTVGISNIQGGADIQVYPNPFNDHINIAGLKLGDKVTIYDLMGRKVTPTWSVDNEQKEQSFRINDLSAGTYILEILDNENLRKASTPLFKQ